MPCKPVNYFALGAILLLLRPGIHAAETVSPTPIDDSPAVVIGGHAVSNYVLSKYHQRFINSIQQNEHREIAAEENAGWMKQFLTQQVIMAHAEALGYTQRPEVVDIVARMERNMLTQPNGPFYQDFLPQLPATEQVLREQFARTSRLLDATVVRFPDADAAVKKLGPDFEKAEVSEQNRRVFSSLQPDETAEQINGRCNWPFPPLVEAADPISSAKRGQWVLHRDAALGLYCIFIRSEELLPPGDFEQQKDGFRAFELHTRQEVVQRRHRAELLQAAGFSTEARLVRQLAKNCASMLPGTGEIGPEIVQAFATQPLCHYRAGAENFVVSVEEFRRHFNRQFVRVPLRSALDLRGKIEDMVIEELDFRAARARGVDRAPQFVQDRLGFAGFQVLDLYEKEVLIPQLGLGASEIEKYYRAHAADFEQTTKFQGRLLRFSSMENAGKWLQQFVRPTSGEASPVPDSDEQLALTSANPLPGLEPFHLNFVQGAAGAKFGPLPDGNGVAIFIRGKTLETATTPLPEVTAQIRQTLTRQGLDQRERELAPVLVANYAVEDHLDYVRYGVTPTTAGAPWHK